LDHRYVCLPCSPVEIDDATGARQSAEQLKAQYEQHLAQGQSKVQDMLKQAEAEAQKVRERLIKQAEEEAHRLSEQTRRQLADDKEKLSRELRQEVASLSVKAAEKLLRHSMNAKEQDGLLQEFFKDLDKETKRAN
jgi:F-type H+-transporting ATPase subunit b